MQVGRRASAWGKVVLVWEGTYLPFWVGSTKQHLQRLHFFIERDVDVAGQASARTNHVFHLYDARDYDSV